MIRWMTERDAVSNNNYRRIRDLINKTASLSRAALKTSAASIVLAVGIMSTPSFAQITPTSNGTTPGQVALTEADTGESIIVTGSRIARPDLNTASPIQVLGQQEFQLSGAVNVEEVLYDLPQIVPSLTGASNNPGDGAATADLRGLGAARLPPARWCAAPAVAGGALSARRTSVWTPSPPAS